MPSPGSWSACAGAGPPWSGWHSGGRSALLPPALRYQARVTRSRPSAAVSPARARAQSAAMARRTAQSALSARRPSGTSTMMASPVSAAVGRKTRSTSRRRSRALRDSVMAAAPVRLRVCRCTGLNLCPILGPDPQNCKEHGYGRRRRPQGGPRNEPGPASESGALHRFRQRGPRLPRRAAALRHQAPAAARAGEGQDHRQAGLRRLALLQGIHDAAARGGHRADRDPHAADLGQEQRGHPPRGRRHGPLLLQGPHRHLRDRVGRHRLLAAGLEAAREQQARDRDRRQEQQQPPADQQLRRVHLLRRHLPAGGGAGEQDRGQRAGGQARAVRLPGAAPPRACCRRAAACSTRR